MEPVLTSIAAFYAAHQTLILGSGAISLGLATGGSLVYVTKSLVDTTTSTINKVVDIAAPIACGVIAKRYDVQPLYSMMPVFLVKPVIMAIDDIKKATCTHWWNPSEECKSITNVAINAVWAFPITTLSFLGHVSLQAGVHAYNTLQLK